MDRRREYVAPSRFTRHELSLPSGAANAEDDSLSPPNRFTSPARRAGRNNAYIANLFQHDFLQKGQKLDAQVLATALSVYATDATLDSTGVAAQYGYTFSGYGVGTATVNVGSNGDAFGVANNTTMTVEDLLLATDEQAVGGLVYNGNTARRNEANAVYSALNDAGNIS